jgi:hypothetical protein
VSVERTAKIKLISVESEKVKEYYKLTVTYKNLDTGKIEVKPMFNFNEATKKAYDTLSKADEKSEWIVGIVKNDKGYLDWVEISPLTGDAVPVQSAQVTPVTKTTKVPATNSSISSLGGKSTYEVNNEIQSMRLRLDEAKQPQIIRQSCIGYAVNLVGPKASVEKVLEVAAAFEQWVYGGNIQCEDGEPL